MAAPGRQPLAYIPVPLLLRPLIKIKKPSLEGIKPENQTRIAAAAGAGQGATRQFVSHSLGCLNVGQHVLDRRLAVMPE